MDENQKFRQEEAVRFYDWWISKPEEREKVQKIIDQNGKPEDMAAALDIIGRRGFYCLIPLIMRIESRDYITDLVLRKALAQFFFAYLDTHSISELCETVRDKILKEIA